MPRSAAISGTDRLERMAGYARAAADDGDEQAADILASLEKVLAVGGSLDEAFGLRSRPGQDRWWRRMARDRRDAALRELFARQDAALGDAGRIDRLSMLIRRYEGINWKVDRHIPSLPAHFENTDRALLFVAFHAMDGDVPNSPKHLSRILR